MIKELLDSAVVRPSNCPFSSPIVMLLMDCLELKGQGELFSLLAGTSNELMDVVIATWSIDHVLKAIVEGLKNNTVQRSNYVWQNDQLRRKDKWVGGHHVALRKNHHKLSSKYFRPFQVIERIRKVAYKLQLPHYANVNPVFHVFQLKPFYVEVATIGEFPQCDDEGLIAANPLKLLERKMVKQKNRMMFYGLIQWSNGEAENATYEKLEDIVSRFPEFVLDP
nr:hypothetical protein [Tanacetum cinerariifolium]